MRNYGLSRRAIVGGTIISPALSRAAAAREADEAQLRERAASWFVVSFFTIFFVFPFLVVLLAASMLVDFNGVIESAFGMFDFG